MPAITGNHFAVGRVPAAKGGQAADRQALDSDQARRLPADVRRDRARVCCFTKRGHNWAYRFPATVEAALQSQADIFLIDPEAVITRDDATPDFREMRSKRRAH